MSTPNTPDESSAPSASSTSDLPAPSSIESALGQAAAGLSYTSETDAPLVPFFWPGPAELTPTAIASAAKAPAGAPIEQQTLEEFLRPVAAEEDWMDDEERALAKRFQALGQALKSLRDVTVFRVGEASKDVYVVGIVDGGLAGLSTKVVET